MAASPPYRTMPMHSILPYFHTSCRKGAQRNLTTLLSAPPSTKTRAFRIPKTGSNFPVASNRYGKTLLDYSMEFRMLMTNMDAAVLDRHRRWTSVSVLVHCCTVVLQMCWQSCAFTCVWTCNRVLVRTREHCRDRV